MKKLFKVLIMILVVTILFSMVGCEKKSSDLEKVKNNKVIYVGITIYDPMDYFDEDGETIIGFDADLANMFAESLGIKAKFVPISWDSKVFELNGGYIDVIWNGMTKTEELGKNIDFSLAYATNYQCVVTKNTVTDINTVEELKTKKVAVEQGSAGDSVATDLKLNLSRVNSQLDAINEVVAGTSDACIIDYTMAYSLVGKGSYASLSIVDANKIAFEQEVFAVGFRKGSDLIAKLDEFFKTNYENGKLDELALKYGVAINKDAFKK